MRKYDVEPVFGHLKNVFEWQKESRIGSLHNDEFKQILAQKVV